MQSFLSMNKNAQNGKISIKYNNNHKRLNRTLFEIHIEDHSLQLHSRVCITLALRESEIENKLRTE